MARKKKNDMLERSVLLERKRYGGRYPDRIQVDLAFSVATGWYVRGATNENGEPVTLDKDETTAAIRKAAESAFRDAGVT